jgi:hypothetical protein
MIRIYPIPYKCKHFHEKFYFSALLCDCSAIRGFDSADELNPLIGFHCNTTRQETELRKEYSKKPWNPLKIADSIRHIFGNCRKRDSGIKRATRRVFTIPSGL